MKQHRWKKALSTLVSLVLVFCMSPFAYLTAIAAADTLVERQTFESFSVTPQSSSADVWGFSRSSSAATALRILQEPNGNKYYEMDLSNASGTRTATKTFNPIITSPEISVSFDVAFSSVLCDLNNVGPKVCSDILFVDEFGNNVFRLVKSYGENSPVYYGLGTSGEIKGNDIELPEIFWTDDLWLHANIYFDYENKTGVLTLNKRDDPNPEEEFTATLDLGTILCVDSIRQILMAGTRVDFNIYCKVRIDNFEFLRANVNAAPTDIARITTAPVPEKILLTGKTLEEIVSGEPPKIAALPSSINVQLGSGATVNNIPIIYECPTYDPDVPGSYLFTGIPDLSDFSSVTNGLNKKYIVVVRVFDFGNAFDLAQQEAEALYTQRPMTPRQMEYLDRAPVAVNYGATSNPTYASLGLPTSGNFISWRLLGTDPQATAFDLYRDGERIARISGATNYQDASGTVGSTYQIKAILNGSVLDETKPFKPLQSNTGAALNHFEIDVGAMSGYQLDEISVGDLDGDGEYEFILLRLPRDYWAAAYMNSTIFPVFQAYEMDGTKLWEINIGPNIADLTDLNYLVADLDGDGRAEFITRTVELTTDGTGYQIPGADHRDSRIANANRQYLMEGEEYLSVFDGLTGKEIARTNYIPKLKPGEDMSKWSGPDVTGQYHRANKFLMCIAYLEGENGAPAPSVVITRGTWSLMMLEAFRFSKDSGDVDGTLTSLWSFETPEGQTNTFYNAGNHNITVADIDFDGFDEIVWGATAYDHDGTGMYDTGLQHGDASHLGKFLPDYPNAYQFVGPHEYLVDAGLEMHDARTGALAFGTPNTTDVGRGIVADIDPRFDGPEMWGASGNSFAYNGGEWINWPGPSNLAANFSIFWDGDLLEELANGNQISKYNPPSSGSGAGSTSSLQTIPGGFQINGTKATPSLQADLFGDWREEYVMAINDHARLRIYTTAIPTEYRIYTLMHDPVYRLGTMWQNVHYAQPPHTGFYLGYHATEIPIPEIYVMKDGERIVNPDLAGKGPTETKLPILYKAGSCTVTFDYNGGKGSVTSKLVTYGEAYGELPEAAREGDIFLGWSADGTPEGIVTAGTVVSINENHTLTAVWEEDMSDGKVRVSLSGPEAVMTNDAAEYVLSAANMNKLATVTMWFEVDGAYFSGKEIKGLNGFEAIGDIVWEAKEGSLYSGRVTLANMDGGVTGKTYTDIFKLTLAVKEALGDTEVKLTRIELSGYDEDGEAVFLGSMTKNGLVGTEIVQRFSPYDVNRDTRIDQLDLTKAQTYYGAQEGDVDWDEAKIADVNTDGRVDIEDLILILNHIAW